MSVGEDRAAGRDLAELAPSRRGCPPPGARGALPNSGRVRAFGALPSLIQRAPPTRPLRRTPSAGWLGSARMGRRRTCRQVVDKYQLHALISDFFGVALGTVAGAFLL